MTGKSARDLRLAPLLAGLLGGAVSCQSLEQASGAAPSAAIAGLIKSTGREQRVPSVDPRTEREPGGGPPGPAGLLEMGRRRRCCWPWARSFSPTRKPSCASRSWKRNWPRCKPIAAGSPRLIRNWIFSNILKQNQPPYLDTIYLLARSAPQGTRLDGLSLGRHQEVSIRLKMANAQQVSDFRSKLIDSGWFTNVIVEEQTPSPDRRVTVRMTADLKPAESRKPLAPEPPGRKTNQPRPGGDEPDFGMTPPPEPMMMPPPQPVTVTPPRRAGAPPVQPAAPRAGTTPPPRAGLPFITIPMDDGDDDGPP